MWATKRRNISLFFLFAVVLFGCYPEYEFAPLEFPFEYPQDIDYLAAFDIPDWSGPGRPHNGIDLRISRQAPITSPVHGTVRTIDSSTTGSLSTPPDLVMVTVDVYVNREWSIKLVLEPSDVESIILDLQMDALEVEVGQEVFPGTRVGDLLMGGEGYPHLHYMVMRNGAPVCAYAHSSDDARAIFDVIAAFPDNNMPEGTICGD